MTGSGKTGLAIALLEEAVLAGVPVVAIDPKGDLANLLMPFEDAREFIPWVQFTGMDHFSRLAAEQAEAWDAGRRAAGIVDRLPAYRERVKSARLYTPGSDAGVPLSILKSFDRPRLWRGAVYNAVAQSLDAYKTDREFIAERAETLCDSLLGLLPANKGQHEKRKVFLAALLAQLWQTSESAKLHDLVRAAFNPPARVGALDIDAWMPERERKKLAQELNTLIGSPRFGLWSSGTPIDFDVFSKAGLNIISIAHLPETERHFITALLLTEAIAWMRQQSGTRDLRMLLYMDEVAGYLPPNGMPAPKRPMLTLLKQGRAFGVGVVLSSQNPMDLDYKACSNMGLWCVGKLTTERDRKRLVDGLRASDNVAELDDKNTLHKTIAGLAKREFYVHDMHHVPVVIHSRHTLCWLRGPVTRDEISRLCADEKQDRETDYWRRLEAYKAKLEQIKVAGDELLAVLEKLRKRRPNPWNLGTLGMLVFGGRFGRMQAMRRFAQRDEKLEAEIAEAESKLAIMAEEADGVVAAIQRLAREWEREMC
jgi:hypothetical protein